MPSKQSVEGKNTKGEAGVGRCLESHTRGKGGSGGPSGGKNDQNCAKKTEVPTLILGQKKESQGGVFWKGNTV